MNRIYLKYCIALVVLCVIAFITVKKLDPAPVQACPTTPYIQLPCTRGISNKVNNELSKKTIKIFELALFYIRKFEEDKN